MCAFGRLISRRFREAADSSKPHLQASLNLRDLSEFLVSRRKDWGRPVYI